MKKIFFLSILIYCNYSWSQTKEETINWLNIKLQEYTGLYMGQMSIELREIDGNEMLFIIDNHSNPLGEYTYIYRVDPKKISDVVTTTEFCTDGTLGIKIISKTNDILFFYKRKQFVNKIDVIIKPGLDNDTIKRMKKGIIHLLNLLGNPIKEQKELFTD